MQSFKQREELNQLNYQSKAHEHDRMGLDSTLYLAYRDIPLLLEKHLYTDNAPAHYTYLDFGCGAGLSTQLISDMLVKAGHTVHVTGVDISAENLKFARERMPEADFIDISVSELNDHTKPRYDLITCNFVLLENKKENMTVLLKQMKCLLKPDGILLVTNCTSKAYNRLNKWYSFNNDFEENTATSDVSGKFKLLEDQSVKVEVFTHNVGSSFTFFDYFHSGNAYREAYQAAGLKIIDTHKPIGTSDDGMAWQSETTASPYKIHVLK